MSDAEGTSSQPETSVEPEACVPAVPAVPLVPEPEEPAVPIASFVRGGTTTAAWDREQAWWQADAERRRAEQDAQFDAAETAGARLYSMRMLKRELGKIALEYRQRDSALTRWCESEIFALPSPSKPGELELAFVLVCPKCEARGVHPDRSQMLVRQSHRMFWVDERTEDQGGKKGAVWVNPDTGEAMMLLGTVTTQDALKCDALGCDWRVRVDGSVVREV